MGKDKSTLRFWLRTDRPNKHGSSPVHLVYQLRGNKRCYSVPDVALLAANWDADDQKAIYFDKKIAKKTKPEINHELLLSSADVDKVNGKLNQVRVDVEKIETRFRLDGKQFDCKNIVDALRELRNQNSATRKEKEDPQTFIADFIQQFTGETTAHKEGTKKAYTGLMNHILRFEKAKRIRMTFENIDVSTIKLFQNFLLEKYEVVTKAGNKKTVQINNITIAKLLSTLKTLLRRAEVEYDIPVNPKYRNFKNPHPRKESELEVIALTEGEFKSIYNFDFSNSKRLDEARDIYCFSIATGLRYGDLEQLEWTHIKKDNTVRMASSDKNGKVIEVPLTPISHAIVQKYQGTLKPLPVTPIGRILSNQKLNDYIKEIGEIAGIDAEVEIAREYGTKKKVETYKKYQLLSIHTGRKTFTSLSLEKGIPLQDVMSLTTHSSFKAVKRYINVTRERKKTVMANAYGEVNPLKIAK